MEVWRYSGILLVTGVVKLYGMVIYPCSHTHAHTHVTMLIGKFMTSKFDKE